MTTFDVVMGSICSVLLVLMAILYAWELSATRPPNRRKQFRDGWGQLPEYEHLTWDDRTWLGAHFDMSEAWRWQ